MKKIALAAMLTMVLAAPAFAQSTPANSGRSEMNDNGTYGSVPCYGCKTQDSTPSDCAVNDPREACRGTGPYDERPYGSAHPGANGLNWQPKNGHDSGG